MSWKLVFLLGLALGVVLGALLAPSPGPEIRHQLRERTGPILTGVRERARPALSRRRGRHGQNGADETGADDSASVSG